jgi:hypothetical protein
VHGASITDLGINRLQLGKDGGDWWCLGWQKVAGKGGPPSRGVLVLAWDQWPAQRLSTEDGGKTFRCVGHTLWQGQQEEYHLRSTMITLRTLAWLRFTCVCLRRRC